MVCRIKLQWAYVSVTLLILSIYIIKVSGIPSGNKLTKTIQYPHMLRYDIFT